MGKGSSPRPFSVDTKTYESNWERIFGTKKEPKDPPQDIKDSQKEQNKCNG